MNWFRNMKVTGKLAIGFGLLVVLTVAVGLLSLQVINQVNAALASNNRNTMLRLAGQLDQYNNLSCPLN